MCRTLMTHSNRNPALLVPSIHGWHGYARGYTDTHIHTQKQRNELNKKLPLHFVINNEIIEFDGRTKWWPTRYRCYKCKPYAADEFTHTSMGSRKWNWKKYNHLLWFKFISNHSRNCCVYFRSMKMHWQKFIHRCMHLGKSTMDLLSITFQFAA